MIGANLLQALIEANLVPQVWSVRWPSAISLPSAPTTARAVQRAGRLRYLAMVQRVEEAVLEAFPQASPTLRVQLPKTALERILSDEEPF